jgi:hypothetical protein
MSRWVIGALAAATLALGLVVSFGGHTEPLRDVSSPPDEGQLLPLPDHLPPWETVAEISPERLGPGEVVDLEARGDTVYLLQPHTWTRIHRDTTAGPFGSNVTGDPNWIAGGAAITSRDSLVYVLDGRRLQLSSWTRTGRRLSAIEIERRGSALQAEHLAVGRDGSIYVSAFEVGANTDGRWMVLRFDGRRGAPDTLLIRPAGPSGRYAITFVEPTPQGELLVVDGLHYVLRWYGPDGTERRRATREGYARWKVPDSVRTEYGAIVMSMPPPVRARFELPEYWPPVRGVAMQPDGRILVLLTAGARTLHAEVLEASGEGRVRLTEEASQDLLFPGSDGVYRIRHEPDTTRIERRRLPMR